MVVGRFQVEAQLETGCSDDPEESRQCWVHAAGLISRHRLLADPSRLGQLCLGQASFASRQPDQTGRHGRRRVVFPHLIVIIASKLCIQGKLCIQSLLCSYFTIPLLAAVPISWALEAETPLGLIVKLR